MRNLKSFLLLFFLITIKLNCVTHVLNKRQCYFFNNNNNNKPVSFYEDILLLLKNNNNRSYVSININLLLLLYSITWWNNRLYYFTHCWVHWSIGAERFDHRLTLLFIYGVSSAALNVHWVIVICPTIDRRCNIEPNNKEATICSESIVNCQQGYWKKSTDADKVSRAGRMGWFAFTFNRSVDAWEGVGGRGKIWYV